MGVSVSNTTRGKLPSLPFARMAEHALGRSYDLSLVLCGDRLSRRLNRAHRGKDKATNILSFSLTKSSGEIYIDLPLAKKQSKKFGRGETNFIAFLFIHGLFHLNGMEHGDRMERAEEKVRSKFGI